MTIDVDAAERFILANARLLERHRSAVLLHDSSAAPVLDTLRAYRNPDGGFGHALEPDVRAPESEVTSALHALEVLAELGAHEDPMVSDVGVWIRAVAHPDGGLPFVLPTAAQHPHAPWMVPSEGGSHVTFAIAGILSEIGSSEPWLRAATEWGWAKLEHPEKLSGYWVKFSLGFLDRVPDEARAQAAIEGLRPQLAADGSLPVPGGTENERLTSLMLSPRPGTRSRVLFTDAQIEVELNLLEEAQQDDGGWSFDWLAWSPGQSAEWRGIVTLRALTTLRENGRLPIR